MFTRLHFKNGRKFLNGFCFLGNKWIKLRRINEFMCLSGAASLNDNLTSTGLTDDSLKNKIIYNEVIHKRRMLLKKEIQKEKASYMEKCKNEGDPPATRALFVKCMADENHKPVETIQNTEDEAVHFPFQVTKNFLTNNPNNNQVSNIDKSFQETKPMCDTQLSNKKKISFENPKRWMEEVANEIIKIEDTRFGTCNPDLPVSNVPCGGCGALLHCTNMTVPGFIPCENFEGFTEAELRGQLCQRCIFLKEYDIALGITVNENDYPKIIAQIKDKRALVILLVDLLDFPCSIWPDIMDVIGKDKPIFVVGNKIDLLINDGKDFVKHRKKCLMYALEDCGITDGNLKHVELISAKTGFGIEKLITAIHSKWGDRGDVYIVGCTNAGKSTLFNTLIQSDFCKSKASDILQRATVSQWPGTTLNLLKFPMLRPCSWRTAIRMQRLRVEKKQEEALREIKQLTLHNQPQKNCQETLMGYIGRSFPSEEKSINEIGLDPEDYNFKFGKWCYDTPGVVHKAQILNLLTTFELSKVLPLKPIVPRNFKLRPGNTLFIGGLARLDFLRGDDRGCFTVYASSDLPVTVTYIEEADFVYQKLLGTDEFAVPCGSKERMEKWPPLMSKDFRVYGKYKDTGGGDIVLSSAGWVSVSPSPSSSCDLRAWTPDGRGIFLRQSCLIRDGWRFKASKISGTPAYYTNITLIPHIKLKFES